MRVCERVQAVALAQQRTGVSKPKKPLLALPIVRMGIGDYPVAKFIILVALSNFLRNQFTLMQL